MEDFKAKVQAELDTSKLEQQLKNLEKGKHKIKIDADTGNSEKGVQNVNKQLQTSQKTANTFGNTLKNAFNIGGSAAVAAKGIQLISDASKSAVKSVEEIDKAIVNLQMATGENRSAVTAMINDYNKMAQQMGATTTQVADAADAWLRQGHSISDTNTLIKDSMMLSKVAGIDAADSTQYLTSAMKGYKVATEDVAGIVDKLTAVDLVSATDAGGLAEAMSRVAVTADSAGISMDRLLGYLATTGEVTQRSMSSIGEAYKTIFTRMSDIKSGKLKLIDEDGTTETLSDVELMLSNVGIDLRKTVTEYNNYQDVLDNLATKWDSLSQLQQNALSKAFAGTRQAEYFRVLMENYDSAKKYADVAANSAGSAEQKFGAYLDSLEAKTNTLKAAFESLVMNNLSAGLVGGIMDASTAVLEFVDDTNLLKSTFAGLAVTGAVKGFALLRTGIMQAATSLSTFDTAMGLVKGTQVLEDDFQTLISLTGNLSKSQLQAVLSSEALSNAQRMTILTSAGMTEAEASAALASMGLATAEGTATGATVTLAGAFRGLMATLAANPLIAVTLGIMAAGAAASALAKRYSNAAEAAQEAQTTYEDTVSQLDSVNSELETTQERIKELQALSANGTITLTQEAELEKLRQQNAELERQKALLEANAQSQQRSATNAAMEALTIEGSQSQYAKDYNLEAVGYTNVIEAAKEDIKHLQDLYSERAKLNQQLDAALNSNDVDGISYVQKQLADNQAEIDRYNESVSGTMADLEGYRNTLAQDTQIGKISGGQEALDALNEIISVYSNLGEYQGEAEQALSQINTFFDGSSGKNAISDQLVSMVQAGDNASDAINKLGLTLGDLGLNDSQIPYLNQYFKDLADSATEAAEAVDKIDGTMSGVKTAMDSQNAGDDLVTFKEYLDTAKDLYDKGLTGTDDFKTVAALINGNVESTTDQFVANYKKLQKYLTTDDDGNLTKSGMNNFAADLKAAGKAAEEAGTPIQNTAQLAKQMGMSTEVLEMMMGRLQDYDISTPFADLPKSAEALSTAQTELQNLKTLYDSMGEGSTKNALGEKLADWEKQINTAENGLESLDTDIILQMKIEYDLASIQAQIDAVKAQAVNGGGAEKWAETIAYQAQYNQTAVSDMGWNAKGIEVPVQYKLAGKSIAALQADLQKAVLEGNTTRALEIQMEISNLYDIQNQILDAFRDAHPEITAETDVTKANETLQKWLNDEGGKELVQKIYAQDNTAEGVESAQNSVDSVKQGEPAKIDAEDNTGDAVDSANDGLAAVPDETNTDVNAEDGVSDTLASIIMQLTGLDKEQSISMVVDDKATPALVSILAEMTQIPEDKLMELNAEDGISGVLQYIIDSYDELPEEMQTKLDATDDAIQAVDSTQEALDNMDDEKVISLTMGTNALDELGDTEKDIVVNYVKGLQEQPDDQNALMSYIISNQDSPENMSALVNYIKNNQDNPDAMSAMLSYIKAAQQSPDGKKAAVDYIKKNQGNPTDKSAKVNYVKGTQERPSVMSTIVNYITGGKKYNGTVHYNGTVNNNYIDSNAFGNWGIAKDETSLVNELGEEVIVRDGKPFTVNNGYPAITKLKRGDIIFNHKQTEELLRKGYVTGSHAEIVGSFASGSLPKTAYASGTKNTIDWYEILLDRAEAIVKKYSTKVENAFLTLSTRLANLSSAISATKSEYAKQQSAYAGYMAAANKVKLSESLKQKVRDGAYYVYDGYSAAEKEAIDKYKDLIEKANQCKQAMDELSQSLADLYKQAFELSKSQYDSEFTALSNYEQLILNNIKLAEAQGYSANPTDYESLIQYMQREVTKGQAEYADLVKKMNDAVASGSVQKWSSEWWDMYNATLEVAAGIQEARISLEEYEQEINQLKWEAFDAIQEQIADLTGEAEFLVDLLSRTDLIDDSGNLTNNGLATLALYNDQVKIYTEQAQRYAEAIREIDRQLADDPGNQNLIDRKAELVAAQQDVIKSAADEKDAIKDLIEEAYDAQIESLQDIVDAYKDSLDAAKDLYDYQKKIQNGTETIASIQKQIAAYSGDVSEESKAKIQKLQVELQDAQEDLQETQADYLLSQQKKLLDDLINEYETALYAGLDDVDATLNNILSAVEDPQAISAAIKDAAADYGYAISDSLSEVIQFKNIEDVLDGIADHLAFIVDAISMNSNNDPVIDPNGNVSTVQESGGVRSKITGFADGGFVADVKKAAIQNGDDIITVNTLKKGEAVLTPQQTQWFQVYADNLPDLSDLMDIRSAVRVRDIQPAFNFDVNMTYSPQFYVDKVNDYKDICQEMRDDRVFPEFIRSMTINLLNGGSTLDYKKYYRS